MRWSQTPAAKQMLAVGERDLIAHGEEIAHRAEIASGVGAAVGDLRRAVERGAAADHHRADRQRSDRASRAQLSVVDRC